VNTYGCTFQKRRDECGFSLLETTITIFVMSVFMAISVPVVVRITDYSRLTSTREGLVQHLRLAQALSEANGQFAMVVLAPFSPRYTNYVGMTAVSTVQFDYHVNYKDDYLQMESGRVTYDTSGNAELSGVIRLQAGVNESDIELFMGSGLQQQMEVLVK